MFLSPESSPRSRSPSPNRDDEADSYYRNSRAMSPKSFRSGSSFAFAGYSTEFQHGISDRLKAAMQTASRGHQYARSNSTTSPRSPLSKNGEKVGRGAEKNSDVQSGRRGGGAKRKPVKNKSYQKDRRHPGLVRRKTNARTNTSRGRALVPGRSSKYGPPPKTLRNLRAVAQPSESLRLSPRSQGGGRDGASRTNARRQVVPRVEEEKYAGEETARSRPPPAPSAPPSADSPPAAHLGPFLLAPRVKRKDSMLSSPSGLPVESIYNVRNERADGQYAGPRSVRGNRYPRMPAPVPMPEKKKHTNFLKRGHGQKRLQKKFKHVGVLREQNDRSTVAKGKIASQYMFKNSEPDETPRQRRARDIDAHDYQGGEGELDEMIRRWKQRRDSDSSNVNRTKAVRRAKDAHQAIFEAPQSPAGVFHDEKSKARGTVYGTPPESKEWDRGTFKDSLHYGRPLGNDPPWRRARATLFQDRRLQIVRPSHGGPAQWLLRHGNSSGPGHSGRYDGAMLITAAQAAVIFRQTNLLKRAFMTLRDYSDRRRWEQAAVAAMCERRAEAHVPSVLSQWRSLFKAVRWHRLRTLTIFLDCWSEFTKDERREKRSMLHAKTYFDLRSGLLAVRKWREYSCRCVVISELKSRADTFWRRRCLISCISTWSSVAKRLAKERAQMLVAGNAHRQGVLRQYFKDFKDGVGMSILENLMEARRNGVLVRRCFFGWANTSGFQERLEEKMLEAQMYDRLTALSRCFWQWENYTKARAAERLSVLHWNFRAKRVAAKKWFAFTVTKRVQRQNSALAVARHRQKVLFGAFDSWHDLATVASAERRAAMYCRLRSIVGGVSKWVTFVEEKRSYRGKRLTAKAHYLKYLVNRWRRFVRHTITLKKSARHWEIAAARSAVKALRWNSQSRIQRRAQNFVANAFARQKRMIRGMILWQQHVDEVWVDREKYGVAVQAYHYCILRKALRGLRLEMVFSKGQDQSALRLRRKFQCSLVRRLLRFWHWYAHRDRALRQYFFQRRTAVIFVAWQRFLEIVRMERESVLLAKLHFRGKCLQKHLVAWKDAAITLLLRRQIIRGAMAWGNRKLGARVLKAWRRVVHMRAVWRGKCRIADDFSRLVLLNRCLLHWNTVTMMGRDYY